MNIQLFSDLHFEHFRPEQDHLAQVAVHPDADVVVLAGDIDSGEYAFRRAVTVARTYGKKVIWIAGNHEFYGQDYQRLLEKFRASRDDGVFFLQDDCIEIDGVRFCGTTLWTDFRLYAGSKRMPTVQEAMAIGDRALNDFRLIRYGGPRFTAAQAAAEHAQSRAWLESILATPFAGKTVVISHHAPHPNSIHSRFSPGRRAVLDSPYPLPGENPYWPINVCFASDLTPLVEKADLWLHGHMHNSAAYQVGNCRVVANPRGYPRVENNRVVWENPDFDPLKLIEI